MGKYFLSLSISAALITLSACSDAEEPETTPAAPATTQAEPTTEEATTEAAAVTEDLEEATTEDAASSTGAAIDPADIEEPEGTALLSSVVPPEKVGDYEGQQLTTDALGDGESTQWQYTLPDNSRMITLVPTSVEHTTMIENLEDTAEPFGEIATCGYLYSNESSPVCMVNIDDGSNLSVSGDTDSSLDEVKAFTSEFLSLVDTE